MFDLDSSYRHSSAVDSDVMTFGCWWPCLTLVSHSFWGWSMRFSLWCLFSVFICIDIANSPLLPSAVATGLVGVMMWTRRSLQGPDSSNVDLLECSGCEVCCCSVFAEHINTLWLDWTEYISSVQCYRQNSQKLMNLPLKSKRRFIKKSEMTKHVVSRNNLLLTNLLTFLFTYLWFAGSGCSLTSPWFTSLFTVSTSGVARSSEWGWLGWYDGSCKKASL